MLFEELYTTALSALRNAGHPGRVILDWPFWIGRKTSKIFTSSFGLRTQKKSPSKHPVQLLYRYSTGLRASLEIMKPDLQKTKKIRVLYVRV